MFRMAEKCLKRIDSSFSSPIRIILSSDMPTLLAALMATSRKGFCVTNAFAPPVFQLECKLVNSVGWIGCCDYSSGPLSAPYYGRRVYTVRGEKSEHVAFPPFPDRLQTGAELDRCALDLSIGVGPTGDSISINQFLVREGSIFVLEETCPDVDVGDVDWRIGRFGGHNEDSFFHFGLFRIGRLISSSCEGSGSFAVFSIAWCFP